MNACSLPVACASSVHMVMRLVSDLATQLRQYRLHGTLSRAVEPIIFERSRQRSLCRQAPMPKIGCLTGLTCSARSR